MVIFTFVLGIILSIFTFISGFIIGKFKGAKDGIDYCFEQRKKELGIK